MSWIDLTGTVLKREYNISISSEKTLSIIPHTFILFMSIIHNVRLWGSCYYRTDNISERDEMNQTPDQSDSSVYFNK